MSKARKRSTPDVRLVMRARQRVVAWLKSNGVIPARPLRDIAHQVKNHPDCPQGWKYTTEQIGRTRWAAVIMADRMFPDLADEKKRTAAAEQATQANLTSFYYRPAWLEVRYRALKLHGRKCQCCGATDKQLHVDHIKPRSKYPELELELSNLQVLCHDCNIGKGAWDETDWRPLAS